MTDTLSCVGKFYEAYDGKTEVNISLVIKHNISAAVTNMYRFVDNVCEIEVGSRKLIGVPYLVKYSKNKLVVSISFGKADNEDNGDNSLMLALSAYASAPHTPIQFTYVRESFAKKVDIKFWDKIVIVLKAIANYSSTTEDWVRIKEYIKKDEPNPSDHAKYMVAQHMTQDDAEDFWERINTYITKYDIPISTEAKSLNVSEQFVAKRRAGKICVVCESPMHVDNIYPLCEKHLEEFIVSGKEKFDRDHIL